MKKTKQWNNTMLWFKNFRTICTYDKWEIDKIGSLTDEAEKARDYLMKLPARMARISERLVIPQESFQFKWVEPARL